MTAGPPRPPDRYVTCASPHRTTHAEVAALRRCHCCYTRPPGRPRLRALPDRGHRDRAPHRRSHRERLRLQRRFCLSGPVLGADRLHVGAEVVAARDRPSAEPAGIERRLDPSGPRSRASDECAGRGLGGEPAHRAVRSARHVQRSDHPRAGDGRLGRLSAVPVRLAPPTAFHPRRLPLWLLVLRAGPCPWPSAHHPHLLRPHMRAPRAKTHGRADQCQTLRHIAGDHADRPAAALH